MYILFNTYYGYEFIDLITRYAVYKSIYLSIKGLFLNSNEHIYNEYFGINRTSI